VFLEKESESIMTSQLKKCFLKFTDEPLTVFEKTKEIITNIRNIRASKNISPKETLTLYVKGEYHSNHDEVIQKLANVSEIKITDKKPSNAITFLVGTTEFSVPVIINAEEEIAKMEAEMIHLESFLKSVNSKLGNEKFMANAKPEVVENERKKQSDAMAKIEIIAGQLRNWSKSS